MRVVYFCALGSGEGDDGWTNTCLRLPPLLASALLRSLDSLICRPRGYRSLLLQWQVPPQRGPTDTLFPKQRNSLAHFFLSSVMHIKHGVNILLFHKQQIHHVVLRAAADPTSQYNLVINTVLITPCAVFSSRKVITFRKILLKNHFLLTIPPIMFLAFFSLSNAPHWTAPK